MDMKSAISDQPRSNGAARDDGLDYLSQVDQLLVHKQKEMLEIFTGWETQNKYKIVNSMGQQVYFAVEVSGMWGRQCCDNIRSFAMKILDTSGKEVIYMERPLKCTSVMCCFCGNCLQEMKVYAPRGNLIGTIHEIFNPCKPKFVVNNGSNDEVFRLAGDACACACIGGSVNFEVNYCHEFL
ncbi:PREDICTED: phospholipid scramblase 1-like [Priapulus caudatus]|uniref:Phospholipid scramblase n=1 Tax=Priapulus caudatus TaxID=37621 RepID=A0ABM1F914_PRICU|nr:PREDICTED: phospholipid scramblase 1-like [Priapulus caudatus]